MSGALLGIAAVLAPPLLAALVMWLAGVWRSAPTERKESSPR